MLAGIYRRSDSLFSALQIWQYYLDKAGGSSTLMEEILTPFPPRETERDYCCPERRDIPPVRD